MSANNCMAAAQFQRSKSLRLRNAKINFNNTKMEHSSKSTSTINPQKEPLSTTKATNDQEANTTAAVGLPRSCSLRRNNHITVANKTDLSGELNIVAGKAAKLLVEEKDLSSNYRSIAATVDTNEPPSDGPNIGKAENVSQITKKMMDLATTTTTAKSTATIANKTNQNVRDMSLNLNGAIVNGTGIASSSKIAAAALAKTPRTPKTPIAPTVTPYRNVITSSTTKHITHQPHPHPHPHCCLKQPLYSVPETKLSPRTPPVTPGSPNTYLDDDLDSVYSFATTTSGRSTMSCEHAYVARNGTTFSGRKMKYVIHCSNHAGQVGPDYLTPTQRAQRQIRRLKELLCVARNDLEQKDSELLRLTREVVELRLFKASLSSPEERSASSDAVTVREAELKTSQDVSPIVDMVDETGCRKSSPQHILNATANNSHNAMQLSSSEMQSSFADSGHFEDMTTSSVHSKDSYIEHGTHDMACGSDQQNNADGADEDDAAAACASDNYEMQRQELIRMYELRIEELIRNQDESTCEMKRTHNDKVEALLQKLAECNTRYADIVPDYEHAKERIRELEKQLEDLQRKLAEHEEKQNKMYLHMYQKGQEAERIARADQALELAHRAPNNKVSINELLHQLQNTQDELENIRAAECRIECGSNHALLTAKEAVSLWVLGARKTIYRRLLEAQKSRTHVDPEVTLQFLKSAVYYFLTDKENSQGHLQAIESILEFTEVERQQIEKVRLQK